MTLSSSLFRQLLVWVLGTFLLVWAAFGYFAYRAGVREADELTDAQLSSVATLLIAQKLQTFEAPSIAGTKVSGAHEHQESLSIFIWGENGNLLARMGKAPAPPYPRTRGFQTLDIGTPSVRWRAFSQIESSPMGRRVTVMLSQAERDNLASAIAEQVSTPGLWLLPVVVLLLGLAIRRGLRPLDDLGRQVQTLDVHRAVDLRGPPHVEFTGIVQAIKMLIQKYNSALERERQLASEVAHELRTPLSSIALNISSLESRVSDVERAQVVKQVKRDAIQAGTVIADLLALARASRTELAEIASPVELSDLARTVVAEYAEQSYQSEHEIALIAPNSCVVVGHPILLQIALRNLIENAFKHTPAGTQIEVLVETSPPALVVQDNGAAVSARWRPAGPAATDGLGLGHQVVRKIAAIHEGSLSFHKGSEREPQRYKLLFPVRWPYDALLAGKSGA